MFKKYYLLPAAFVPFLASIIYFNLLDGSAAAKTVYLLSKIFIFAYPLFFLSRTTPFKTVFAFNLRELLLGILIGTGIFICGLGIIHTPALWKIIETATPFVMRKATSLGVAEHFILTALIVSFIHSMLEEYYWRWFLYGASGASVFSAMAFSLHHFIVLDYYYDKATAFILTLLVFAGGLIFNALYERKKNIWGAWAAHVGADLLIFYVGHILLNGAVNG